MLPFQTRLTQKKLVLPLSKEHGSQAKIKVDGSIVLHVMYLYFQDRTLISNAAVLLLSVGLPVANAPDVLQLCGLLYYP